MLKFVGDICFSDSYFDAGLGVGSAIANGADPFSKLSRDNNDIWVGNFECVCADNEDSSNSDKSAFIIAPDLLKHLNHMNIYGVSNNHVMQHGAKAYQSTLRAIEAYGAQHVGSLEKPIINFHHQGKDVSIISFSQRPEHFNRPEYVHLPEYTDIIRSNSRFSIAYIHWGIEFMNYPYLDQRQFARFLIDSGFDLIIGTHPHILQGYEIYKGKYIFYSLGNFIFNMAWEPTKYGAVVYVDLLKDEPKISFDYIKIESDYFPILIPEKEVPENYRFSTLNTKVNRCVENELYFREAFANTRKYRNANYKAIVKRMAGMNKSALLRMVRGFISRRIKR